MRTDLNEKGSITVFLSLVFVLVFSLIMTSLEAAKSAAARSFARMLLVCAAESEAAQFYRPLFDEYHLFGIDTGFGGSAGNISRVASETEMRIPPNIWKIETTDCELTAYEMMADGTGDIFTEQAVSYELLKKAGDLLSGLAEKLGLISKQGKTAKVLKKRLEAEEKIARIDELTLDLMKNLDGVICDISGNSNVHYTIGEGFVKRFLNVPASMQTAQINNSEIYAALSGKYVNPVTALDELNSLVRKYAEALAEEERCQARLEGLRSEKSLRQAELTLARDALTAVNAVMEARIAALRISWITDKDDKTGDDDKNEKDGGSSGKRSEKESELNRKIEEIRQEYSEEIMYCENEITRIELALGETETKISEEETMLRKYKTATQEKHKAVSEKAGILMNLFDETAAYVQEALMCIMRIKTAQAEAEPMIDEYGQTLNESKGDMTPEAAQDYEDAYELMEEYMGNSYSGRAFDYEGSEISLRKDKKLLEECGYQMLLSFGSMDSKAAYKRAEDLTELKRKAAEFVYDGFVFDYSSFTAKSDTETGDIAGDVLGGLGEGFLALILKDAENLSKAVISSALLPSGTIGESADSSGSKETLPSVSSDGTGGAAAMADSIEQSDMGGLAEMADDLSDGSASQTDVTGTEYSDLNRMVRSIGLAMYFADCFACYTNPVPAEDTVLKYEQEYIVAGKLSDSENISSVVLRILLLRLVTSGIYVFSDSELNNKAELIATAAVGFTGMPFLIALAKYLILFACALEQAMIETSALTLGRKIAIVTGKEGFMIDIADLARFSATFIQQKAESYPEIRAGIDYGEYLCILMMLTGQKKSSYRAMDLIQENLRYEYNEDYLMINCLTGFSVKASFEVRPQFVSFGGYRISADYVIRY